MSLPSDGSSGGRPLPADILPTPHRHRPPSRAARSPYIDVRVALSEYLARVASELELSLAPPPPSSAFIKPEEVRVLATASASAMSKRIAAAISRRSAPAHRPPARPPAPQLEDRCEPSSAATRAAFERSFLAHGRVSNEAHVLAFHPAYLEVFLRTGGLLTAEAGAWRAGRGRGSVARRAAASGEEAVLSTDYATNNTTRSPHHRPHRGTRPFVHCAGPLPVPWRYYIAAMAAARHACGYLVRRNQDAFLAAGVAPLCLWRAGRPQLPLPLVSNVAPTRPHSRAQAATPSGCAASRATPPSRPRSRRSPS